MSISAIFKFIAKYPISILIAGGILCVILGAFALPFYPETANVLIGIGCWMIGGGALLHFVWLLLKYKKI